MDNAEAGVVEYTFGTVAVPVTVRHRGAGHGRGIESRVVPDVERNMRSRAQVLSSGPFLEVHPPSEEKALSRRPTLPKLMIGKIEDSGLDNVVQTKQVRGWRRVLVVQRRRENTDRPEQEPPQQKYSGTACRWGKAPPRLRLGAPHALSTLEIEGQVAVPRAESKGTIQSARAAPTTASNRREEVDLEFHWPFKHRWGSQTYRQPPNSVTGRCHFYEPEKDRLAEALDRSGRVNFQVNGIHFSNKT